SRRTAPVLGLTLSRPKNFWRAEMVAAERGFNSCAVAGAVSENNTLKIATDNRFRIFFLLVVANRSRAPAAASGALAVTPSRGALRPLGRGQDVQPNQTVRPGRCLSKCSDNWGCLRRAGHDCHQRDFPSSIRAPRITGASRQIARAR